MMQVELFQMERLCGRTPTVKKTVVNLATLNEGSQKGCLSDTCLTIETALPGLLNDLR